MDGLWGAPVRRSTAADIELIRGVGLFSGSTSEVVDEVISESSVERFKNRDFICRAGDSAEVVFLVLQGKVQVVRGTPTRHAVLMVMQRGDAFGLRGVLEVGEYTETVVAVGECQILTIPAATFAHAMEQNAAVASSDSLAGEAPPGGIRPFREHSPDADDAAPCLLPTSLGAIGQ